MPGSPTSMTSAPSPAAAALKASRSCRSSRSRPTNGERFSASRFLARLSEDCGRASEATGCVAHCNDRRGQRHQRGTRWVLRAFGLSLLRQIRPLTRPTTACLSQWIRFSCSAPDSRGAALAPVAVPLLPSGARAVSTLIAACRSGRARLVRARVSPRTVSQVLLRGVLEGSRNARRHCGCERARVPNCNQSLVRPVSP
jgi:hypothetical protein